ncbi:hypothetical protein ABHF33_09480 [Chitinibacter sp. FCG-7]|uniref:Type 4 fimbrial biogenesis protein PilX N-terminal domain-containing protein n=1 Tax=Chitinibacter mangrovi TaxID=3153927 RepID=A0AAU7F6S0_9NEIS
MNPSLYRQHGATTLLVSSLLLIVITLGGLTLSRQVIQDSKASNQLFFRAKALEAANAGVAGFTAQLIDKNKNKTLLNGLNATPGTVTLDAKYALSNLAYSLKANTIANDPVTGLPRLQLSSTGCLPADCSDAKAVVTQYISYEQVGGVVNDYLSINDTLNRVSGTSVTVHSAPNGASGIGYGNTINNCTAGQYAPATASGCSTSAGSLFDSTTMYYTNWEPKTGMPPGYDCTLPGNQPNCQESPTKKAATDREQKSDSNYFKQYFGTKDKNEIKARIDSGDLDPNKYIWIEGDATTKGDHLIYKPDGNPIDPEGKIVIITGNLNSGPSNWFQQVTDHSWGMVYVGGDVNLSCDCRIKGMMAVEGNMNVYGSLHFWADPGAKSLFDEFIVLSYAGKSGWRDF